jgi:demethylmenaquinone methyltransferase / 2-methoxy-6-polyprenyl-1,4-benzoquinol methylase
VLDKRQVTIQKMFAEIAPRYDRANRLLSFRTDLAWRKHVARALLPSPGVVLDLAAGTGDLTVDLVRHGAHKVVAADFTYEMLHFGRTKVAATRSAQTTADALALPFRSARFDGVTVAFGIRNFADPLAGLREIHRVLKPGGVAGVLEFSRPVQPIRFFYQLYSRFVLPALGGAITGRRAAYEYLPASVAAFPEGESFTALMREAGFDTLTRTRMTGGIVTFYRGIRR